MALSPPSPPSRSRRRPDINQLRTLLCLAVLLLCAVPLLVYSKPQAASPQTLHTGNLNLTFTTIDVPGAGITNIQSINSNGAMAGSFGADSFSPGSGFIYANGSFTTFDYPSASSTLGWGINDSGLVSGTAYLNNNTTAVGFLYDGVTFTTLSAPGKSATFGRGINNASTVVGAYGFSGVSLGFEMIGGNYKSIRPPGSYTEASANGINNFGQIAGTTDGTAFTNQSGSFRTISFPGASSTQALGINDSGIIVGWYVLGSCVPCGFAYKNGKYLSFNVPGAVYTFGLGINNAGQIVGSYSTDQQTYHGFVSSPISAASFDRVPPTQETETP